MNPTEWTCFAVLFVLAFGGGLLNVKLWADTEAWKAKHAAQKHRAEMLELDNRKLRAELEGRR